MPLSNILAVPFDVTEEDHERVRIRRLQNYGDPEDPEDIIPDRNDTLLSKQTMLRIKCCQLIATIATIVFFIYAKSQSRCINVDLLISAFFGALLMYPIMILCIPNHNQLSIVMMLLNLISSLMLFTNGYFIFTSWYALKNYLIADAILPADPMSGVATFQFLAATFSFIIGTVYGSEVFIQLIDNIRQIF